jgi:hypothetical protein
MNSPVKALKSVPFTMAVSGGRLPKATSLRIFLFFILLMQGFIAKTGEFCQMLKKENSELDSENIKQLSAYA